MICFSQVSCTAYCQLCANTQTTVLPVHASFPKGHLPKDVKKVHKVHSMPPAFPNGNEDKRKDTGMCKRLMLGC